MLRISHGAFEGSWSEFMTLRQCIANEAGYGSKWTTAAWLEEMLAMAPENFLGEWEDDPPDVLAVLLAHRDNAGIIPYRYTFGLAARLEQMSLSMDPSIKVPGTFEPMRDRVRQFSGACLAAHHTGEDMQFEEIK